MTRTEFAEALDRLALEAVVSDDPIVAEAGTILLGVLASLNHPTLTQYVSHAVQSITRHTLIGHEDEE